MFRELTVSEQEKTIDISTGAGPVGGRFGSTLNLNNPVATAQGLYHIFSFEDAIRGGQISALLRENHQLKKQALQPSEIQYLVRVPRSDSPEVKATEQQIVDGTLVDKLEAMLKN